MPDADPSKPTTQAAEKQNEAATAATDAANATPTAGTEAGSATTATDAAVQLIAAKAEASANYDKYMRAVADLENFRRRAVREKDELRTIATGRVLEDLFPVLDNLSLAVAHARQPNADVKSLLGGVEMVLSQLKSALGNHGVKDINPVGQPFDPHQHEAISHEPSATVKAEHVINVVRTGYSLNGRLLRAAAVTVSSGPAKPAPDGKPA
ncbi:nucleotide exchange factor GrpE [Opitutus sp. ER46]|uniref:nucleotide exchange factor GrpE n=1 Tax=Opitutus sp. ER46 TaxID=2161864 RepID=UPI000D2FAB4D|nr:nucleotide exchange factor GrpE [Opitutus sp. ER46]PTX97930.1 nucleotide exchange factor GrpE [Opitutus sp. ER46]